MTPLAIRMSRRRNGVSRLHGEVSRADVASRSSRARSSRRSPTSRTAPTSDVRLGDRSGGCSSGISATRGCATPTAPCTGKASARSRTPSSGPPAARRGGSLVDYLRDKCAQDSLLRGEQLEYVRRIELSLDPDALTIGFARRLATYKRFHLLNYDAERARRIFAGEQPAQLVIAGKAHPNDEPGKDALQRFYDFEHADWEVAGRVVIVEDYDIGIARAARLRLRPLAQPAAQADGGERHERDEGDVQRCAPAERPRRLVGGGLRRHERLGDPRRRRRGSRDGRRARRGALLRPARARGDPDRSPSATRTASRSGGAT